MSQPFKYPRVNKNCPVCGTQFIISKGNPREKVTCSHACANTYFRSGKSNPNYKEDNDLTGQVKYYKICFRYHFKKCVCCDETNIVEVHHYDGNHNNDDPKNLVPLCPTHHRYWHSKFRYLIKDIVDRYVKHYIINN